MKNRAEQQGGRPLPEIEQAIAVCRDLGELTTLSFMLEDGAVAGVVVRASSYDDFESDILDQTMSTHKLEQVEKRDFTRKPVSRVSQHGVPSREQLHLDVEYPPFERSRSIPHFPYAITIGRVVAGEVLYVAAQASARVRGWSEDRHYEQRRALNISKDLMRLRTINPQHWFNATYQVHHKGIRGPVGAVYLGEGDVFMVPQGGGETKSPAWHAIITPPRVERESHSYHLAPAEPLEQA